MDKMKTLMCHFDTLGDESLLVLEGFKPNFKLIGVVGTLRPEASLFE